MKNTNTKEIKNTRMKKGQYHALKKGFLKTALLFSLPLSMALAEDDGFYMGVGYQIGGAQQNINNKGSTLRNNVIDDFRQVGVGMAGGNGLLTLATNTTMDALLGIGNQIINTNKAVANSNAELTQFKKILPQIEQRFEADKNAYSVQALQVYLSNVLYNLVNNNNNNGSNNGVVPEYVGIIKVLYDSQSEFSLLATESVALLNALTRVNLDSNSVFLKGLLAQMQLFNDTSAAKLSQIAEGLNKSGGAGAMLQKDVKTISDRIATYQENLKQLGGMLNNYDEPYLPQFGPGQSSQHGVINGFGIQMGYKQFFGSKKNIGLRYYAFFDYGFTQLGSLSSAVKANIFTYGAGTDFLWNIFRRVFSDQSLNVGVFGGIQIAGNTWDSSLRNQIKDSFKENPTPTNFQFLFNLGLRAHFASTMHRRFLSASQSIQHGMEFGVKIPAINQRYLRANGADVDYRRLYAFYINYTIGF
ncbi:Hop family outer membrane protein HopG [Helicobacter pylori]|uniref:Hop family outer membrane protein HopG n=1 Tax=Helicobacter pylori TaxID=210 RepID=UPI0002BADBF1|nr:Hop family outer membrane protein HopG [Helicobacter pylori]EMH49129.1 outer membrane protein [Helicobacter pylori HP116Bi]